jgi:hypothetical protein
VKKKKAKVNFSVSYLVWLNLQVIELYELMLFLNTWVPVWGRR